MGQRLLLVDSDRSFLKEHQVTLESAFDLDMVASPDGVMQRLESGAYAAALISVEVAENKGYALCSTIRKNAGLADVKLALISAKATEEEYRRHQSLKGKADLYLHKPIAPSALVAALAPLVPGRAVDPDNPLGELADTELGDDWLESLKQAAEPPAAPVFGVRPEAPPAPPSVPAPSPADASRVRLLEEQVSALQSELRAKDQRLLEAEAEVQQVQRRLNSVTLNLDELERSNREAETLKNRLADTEAALRILEDGRGRDSESAETLKAQLKEALAERTDLIHQVESLNQQVGEKTQRAIELLKERDRLLHDNLDLEPLKAKVPELEATLAARDEALQALAQERDAGREAQEQMRGTLEELVAKHASLEDLHQSALLEVAGFKEKVHTLHLEVAGLEATMRGQGRDLAELSERLQQREAELEGARTRLAESERQGQADQETLREQEEELARLNDRLASTRQELDEMGIQHEGERLELMNGLDQKEGELARLTQALGAQQEAAVDLEREKQAVHGQLAEHRDRLQNLDGLLKDIQEQLRRGSDLARG